LDCLLTRKANLQRSDCFIANLLKFITAYCGRQRDRRDQYKA